MYDTEPPAAYWRAVRTLVLADGSEKEVPVEERGALESIHRAVAADGYRLRTMVHQIIGSLPFQARRGEDPRNAVRSVPIDSAGKR